MAVERTLSIIKPDAIASNVIGKIYTRFETNGLKIVAAQMRHLSRAETEGFYAVHRERPFFRDLVDFMTSGPVMIQVLEGLNHRTANGGPDGAAQEGMLTQQGQGVADVGRGPASTAFQVVNHERHIQHVRSLRQDVVAEPSGEHHDRVVRDGSGHGDAAHRAEDTQPGAGSTRRSGRRDPRE